MERVRTEPLRTEEEYRQALARFWEIFGIGLDSPDYAEHELLSDLIEAYEDIHYPMSDPPPLGALEFWIDQMRLTPDDLATCLGGRELTAAVLAGQQEITPAMAQALYERLDIDLRELVPEETPAAVSPA